MSYFTTYNQRWLLVWIRATDGVGWFRRISKGSQPTVGRTRWFAKRNSADHIHNMFGQSQQKSSNSRIQTSSHFCATLGSWDPRNHMKSYDTFFMLKKLDVIQFQWKNPRWKWNSHGQWVGLLSSFCWWIITTSMLYPTVLQRSVEKQLPALINFKGVSLNFSL